jgi:hypothetical protein
MGSNSRRSTRRESRKEFLKADDYSLFKIIPYHPYHPSTAITVGGHRCNCNATPSPFPSPMLMKII